MRKGDSVDQRSFKKIITSFIIESRKNKIWRRVTNTLAVLVVFVTTYMLILPAITLTIDTMSENSEFTEPEEAEGIDDGTEHTAMLLSSSENLTSSFVTVTGVSYENATYNGSNYTAELKVNFSVPVDSVTENDYKCQLYLPEGVSPPSTYNGDILKGYDNSSKLGFTYTYQQDTDTGLWYADITFLTEYVNEKSGDMGCYISFSATIDESCTDEKGNIKANFYNSTTFTFEIPVENITSTDENVTPNADLTVTKSAGSYDAAANSITYTLYVSSNRGTTEKIKIEDLLTLTDGLSVGKIKVDSVLLQSYTDGWGTTDTGTYLLKVETSEVTSGNYYYETVIPEAGDTTSSPSMSIILPAILKSSEYGGRYVISYTVYLDPVEMGESGTVTNSATGKTYDSWKGGVYIESSSGDKTVNVSLNILSKSGKLNSDGTITWTIVVNSDGQNIAGFTLTDKMFSSANANGVVIAVNDSTVTATAAGETVTTPGVVVNGTGFAVYADSNGVTGITFTSDGGTDGTNTNLYTITFTAPATSTWASKENIKNTASLSGGSTSVSADGIVYVQGGDIAKTFNSAADGTTEHTEILNWTTKATIPLGGIASGTVLTDYVGGEYAYNGTTIYQWCTYEQITALLEQYQNSIVFDGMSTAACDTTTDTTNPDYKIEVYDYTQGKWVSLSELLDSSTGSSTYGMDQFTAYQITFLKNISVDSAVTWTFSYDTTADTTAVDDGTTGSVKYDNEVKVQNGSADLQSWPSHTEYATVIKTDGKGQTGTSTTVTSDGALTWIVKVYVPSGCTSDSFTITDTLPENVSLTSAKVEVSYLSCTFDLTDVTTGTLTDAIGSGTVTLAVDGQNVTIQVFKGAYDWLGTSSGYITITYNCQLDSSLLTSGSTSVAIGKETNTVTVETVSGGSSTVYGTTSQTQDVTYQEETVSKDTVSKSASWDDNNRELTYHILLNPAAEDLLADSDTLEFSDVLKANFQQYWGIYATLINTFVKFYQLEEGTVTEDGVYVAYTGQTYVKDDSSLYNDGNTWYLKVELDIGWTYAQVTSYYNDNDTEGYTTHTIAANVPDKTALLVEYKYTVWVDSTSSYKNISGLTNTATLKGDSASSSSDSRNDYYSLESYSAGVYTTESLNLIKVDSTNYGKTLSGAVYELYWYQDGNWVDTELSFTTESGNFMITKDLLESKGCYAANTAYYLVEKTAPNGYLLDAATKYYFYWSDSSNSNTSYPDGFKSQSNVANLSVASKSIYAPNTTMPTTSVSVEKVWADQDGERVDGNASTLPESVTVDLYRYVSTTKPATGSGDSESGDSESGDSGSGDSESGTTSGSVTVTVGSGQSAWDVTLLSERTIPVGKDVTIIVNASNVNEGGSATIYESTCEAVQTNNKSSTVSSSVVKTLSDSGDALVLKAVIKADDIGSNDITFRFHYWGCTIGNITITYDGESTSDGTGTDTEGDSGSGTEGESGSGTGDSDNPDDLRNTYKYTESDLKTSLSALSPEKVGESYTITKDDDGNWSYTVTDLDTMYYASDGTVYYYYYYFVEHEVSGYDTYYAMKEGVASTEEAFSILNVETEEEQTYTSVTVDKSWAYKDSSETVSADAKSAVTFFLYRVNTKDTVPEAELAGSVTLDGDIDDTEETAWFYTWNNLLQEVTDESGEVTASYQYYIVENCETVPSGCTVAETVTASEGTTGETSDISSQSITVTKTDGTTQTISAYPIQTEKDSSTAVSVTNTIEKPNEKTICVKKVWKDSGTTVVEPADASVTFSLWQVATYTADNGEELQTTSHNSITLSSGDEYGWFYKWENLPTTGKIAADGNTWPCTYSYYISEDDANFGSQKLSDFNVTCVEPNSNSAIESTTLTYTTTENGAEVTENITAYQVALSEDETATVTITNECTRTSIVLPATGSAGRGLYYLLGILCMLLASLGLAMRHPAIARCLKTDYRRISTVLARGGRYRKTKFSS